MYVCIKYIITVLSFINSTSLFDNIDMNYLNVMFYY